MQPHVPTIDRVYDQMVAQHEATPITESEFEGWRDHPVTRRLFDEFEIKLAEAQGELSEELPSSNIPLKHAHLNGYHLAVTDLFEWLPDGLSWEEPA